MMKTYIDRGNTLHDTLTGMWIPKDQRNARYAAVLEEVADGDAEIVPYVAPAPTPEEEVEQTAFQQAVTVCKAYDPAAATANEVRQTLGAALSILRRVVQELRQ